MSVNRLVPTRRAIAKPAISKRLTMPAHRMLALTIVDQGVSSVSNFAVAILIAHYSTARVLGIFALTQSTYIVAIGVARAFTSNCLLTRPETDDTVMLRYEQGGYLVSLFLSLLMAIVVLAVCPALRSGFTWPLLILALSLPMLALQDFARYIGISRHDPMYAISLDAAWLVIFGLLYVGLRWHGLVSMTWLFGAWCLSGAAVGLVTLLFHFSGNIRPLLSFWQRSERGLGLRFAGQFLVSSVSNYLIFYLLVLFVISVAQVGTIKLALLAVGPVTVMSAGVQSAVIALAAKRFRVDRDGAMRFLAIAGAGMAVVAGLWSSALYFAPVHTLTRLLGPTWPDARGLLPFGGLALVLMCFGGIGTSGLQALRAARANLLVALCLLPVFVCLPIAGAAVSGTHGYVVAAAGAGLVYSVVVWLVLGRTARSADLEEPGIQPGEPKLLAASEAGL